LSFSFGESPHRGIEVGVWGQILFIMETKELVLDAMKKAGAPVNAGKLVDLTGLERKEVDKAMKQLKADDAIVSPKVCFWQPK
jgi:hypothetical protein